MLPRAGELLLLPGRPLRRGGRSPPSAGGRLPRARRPRTTGSRSRATCTRSRGCGSTAPTASRGSRRSWRRSRDLRRRWIIAGAVAAGAVLLVAGAGLGLLPVRQGHQGRDIRGSSTVEFVPTQPAPTADSPGPAEAEAGEARGADARRLADCTATTASGSASCRAGCARRSGSWTFRARHLVEFPPRSPTGACTSRPTPGVSPPSRRRPGRRGGTSGRCIAASPAVADGVVFTVFLNLPTRRATRSRAGPGSTARWSRSPSASGRSAGGRDRPDRDVAARRGGRVYVGDWNGDV